MKLNESNHETSKQIHVCPYCLQDVPEGSICPCITEGDPEAFTVKTRIEALTLHSRERVLEMIELCESRELREAKEKVEPEVLTDRTTPPTTNSPEAVTDNSLSDDDKAWADAFIRLKYGISRLENCAMIDDAICALMATRERLTNDLGTESMILCIEAKLQAIYNDLETNRRYIINDFNTCFLDDDKKLHI